MTKSPQGYHHYKGNNLTPSEKVERKVVEILLSSPLSDKEREKYSDAVILNDDKHSLIEQVMNLHKNISGK